MKLLIDNLDGRGPVDYTQVVIREKAIEIARKWNEPSVCTAGICTAVGMDAPLERARVIVLAEDDSTLFTGFVQSATQTGTSVIAMRAVSDELLADNAGGRAAWQSLGGTLASALQRVVSAQGAGMLDAGSITDGRDPGVVSKSNAGTFSMNVGAIARAGRVSYRALGTSVSVLPVGAQLHSHANVAEATWQAVRPAVNDVCVSGEMEPAAYVTECFVSDGSTSSFELMHAPFREKTNVLVDDAFVDASFSGWQKSDAGGWIACGGAGVVMSGGDGSHGHTYLQSAVDGELGGALLAEVADVLLSGACDGVLCGFYDGGFSLANCVAGVRIRQSSGVTIAFPLVNGAETGSAFALAEGHRYTFRVRLFADAARRLKQVFRVGVNGTEVGFGGGVIACAGRVVCDLQDLGLASNTAATVLCDASIAALPATAQFVAVECAQMFGTMRSAVVRREIEEVRRRDASGHDAPVLIGVRGEGADASLNPAGMLTFFDGRVPDVGETIVVRYRLPLRAVARREDADAISVAGATGYPGRVQWEAQVVDPVARSSEDCEQAAAALLAIARDAGSGRAGECVIVGSGTDEDIWPGDAILDAGGSVIVRAVRLCDEQTRPESIAYRAVVANEWAGPLSVTAHERLHADAVRPLEARTDANSPLSDLLALRVVAVTDSSIQVDAGCDAPTGGGFEVRRWDAGFGSALSGPDADLVLRSPVRGFDIPRAAQQETYYVRMYDASSPPRYSRFSAAVRVTAPMG